MKKDMCNTILTRGKDCHCGGGNSNPIYGLGVIGSLFYFLQGANSFSLIVVGIAKSFFWPAVVLFKVLTDLHL